MKFSESNFRRKKNLIDLKNRLCFKYELSAYLYLFAMQVDLF